MKPGLSLTFGAASAGRSLPAAEIAAVIAAQLKGGADLAGMALPPPAVLAARLGVPPNVVRVAYAALRAQGLVRPEGRSLIVALGAARGDRPRARGSRRSAARRARTPGRSRGEVQKSGRNAGASPVRTRIPHPEFVPAPSLHSAPPRPEGWLQLGSVFIDPRLLPRDVIEDCLRRALRARALPALADPQGYAPLREQIAARLRARGIDARAEHVITTVGSQQAIELVCRTLTPGAIATESPAYELGKHLLQRAGRRVVGLRVDPFAGIDAAAWERTLRGARPRLAYLTPRFQNPTGYSYSSAELLRIAAWAERIGFGVLEDDWASEMRSHSDATPSLRALFGSAVLYMNSFTKKAWPALRSGYLLANAETTPALLATKRVAIGSCPIVGEIALAEFLEQGHYDAHLRRLQPELDGRYHNCLELLRGHMPEEVRWTLPGGGPVLWLEVPPSVDRDVLAGRLHARRILLPLGDQAFCGAQHLHGYKLGYAALDSSEMQRGIEALAEELRRLLTGPDASRRTSSRRVKRTNSARRAKQTTASRGAKRRIGAREQTAASGRVKGSIASRGAKRRSVSRGTRQVAASGRAKRRTASRR